MIALSKLSESQKTITLGWTPPALVDMYAFYADGKRVSTGDDTFKDGTPRNKVEFAKGGEPYEVVALIRKGVVLYEVDAGQYPAVASELPFAEAALRPGFQTIKVDASATNLGGQGSAVAGGNDVLLDLQNLKHSAGMLFWGGAGQRIKVINCGEWDITAPRTSGAYGRGGPRVRSADNVGPEHISFINGLVRGEGLADALVAAPLNPTTIVTMQRFRVEYPLYDVAESSEHVDAAQLQGRLKRWQLGLCSIQLAGVKAGNDRGKGMMLNLAPQAPLEVEFDKVNFWAPNLLTGAAIFQAYRDIVVRMTDVYVKKDGPNGNTWSQGSGLFYPQNWISSGQAPNRVATWPSGTNMIGEVREGVPPGGDYCV